MGLTDGFLCIYKEKGMTSHDVVFQIRKILHTKKTGHAGTLDPNAEGVLIVGVGKATRLIEYLEVLDKDYQAEVIFGRATDTDDVTGQVLEEGPSLVTKEALHSILPKFTGELLQRPPVYSAIKIKGKKLYQYARKGQEIDIPKRQVKISKLICTDDSKLPEQAVIEVTCSKGTYIRSLCRDLGEELNTPACMGELLRTRCGTFDLKNAVKLSELEELAKEDALPWIEMDAALSHFPSVQLTPRGEKMVGNGCLCYPWSSETSFEDFKHGELLRFHGHDGLLGIGRFEADASESFIRPVKIIPKG